MILGSIHCAIMYVILLIHDVDQKDRSLWKRNCYCLRNRPSSPLFYLILPREGFFLTRNEQSLVHAKMTFSSPEPVVSFALVVFL